LHSEKSLKGFVPAIRQANDRLIARLSEAKENEDIEIGERYSAMTLEVRPLP
jgi:hypothetical protein